MLLPWSGSRSDDVRLGMCLSRCSFLVKDFPQYAQKTIVTGVSGQSQEAIESRRVIRRISSSCRQMAGYLESAQIAVVEVCERIVESRTRDDAHVWV